MPATVAMWQSAVPVKKRVVAVCVAAELEEVEPADEAGAALAARWKGLLAHVQALRPLERFRVASVGYRRWIAAP
jgi:hypothetical protein